MKLFTVAAIYKPKNEKGVLIEKDCKVIIKPDFILSKDEKTAGMKMIRKIPAEYEEKLDDVEVLVRPF